MNFLRIIVMRDYETPQLADKEKVVGFTSLIDQNDHIVHYVLVEVNS